MKTVFGWLIAACLLAACGSPDEGPEIRNFDALTKKESDAPFKLAPSSKSPATFNFASSNTAVATVDKLGEVTIQGAGQTTLTASQQRTGSFGPTEKTALLTVTEVACASGEVRIGGKCVAKATCISPATLNAATNKCVAPVASASPVTVGSRKYMGATFSADFATAKVYCESTQIDGQGDWRLPTVAELNALIASGMTAGGNWVLDNTWTSTPDTAATSAAHFTVNLATGAVVSRADSALPYVSCVR